MYFGLAHLNCLITQFVCHLAMLEEFKSY